MRTLPENSVDAVVTDPPYGLEFMGVAWDTFSEREKGKPRTRNEWKDFGSREHPRNATETARIARNKNRAFEEFSYAWACEAIRVLKPGGHLLAMGGTRTFHRLVCAIEDAGFECRDTVAWLYGQGFPKSLDVSKQLDRMAYEVEFFNSIRSHIGHWRDVRGFSNARLNEAIGSSTTGCGMVRHWTTENGSQHSIPSKDQWRKLKVLLSWPDGELDAVYDAVKDGAERPVISQKRTGDPVAWYSRTERGDGIVDITAPATDAAKQWSEARIRVNRALQKTPVRSDHRRQRAPVGVWGYQRGRVPGAC
jgi:hypothetical protein